MIITLSINVTNITIDSFMLSIFNKYETINAIKGDGDSI